METGKKMILKLILNLFIISLILIDHRVLSCSSKSVPTRPPTTTIPTTIKTTTSTTTELPRSESPGVWSDRSSHSQHLSIVNGHNEDLLVKPLPTQEDRGISERQGGSLSHHDQTISDNYNNKNNKPLALVQFSNKSIQCNDKTTAGYYLRKSPLRNNNIWIVFLEGGWYCFDGKSCQNRWLRLKNLMSSASWPHYKYVGGILSSDPSENPYWWSANHVFVPYCSSDTWSGTAKAGVNGSPFSFMGALIVDEVVKNLIKREGLQGEDTVILAGSSAGGTGVLINLDRVDNLLTEQFGNSEPGSPNRVRGISDSGWFIDKLPSFSDKVDCDDVILCPPEISLKKGMTLWNARLPQTCQSSYPDHPWSCFFGYRLYPTLKASLFVFQWLFDEAQMLVNNVPTPALKKEEWDYIYRVGDELKKTLINVTNVFIPACMAHTVLTHRDWKRVEVNSVYLPRALKCWESGGIIEESNFIPSRYWEEDEESSLSNVNRKTNGRSGKNNNVASPSSTTSSSVLEQSDFPVVVSSNDSSRRNRRRHGHNRHNRHRPPNGKRERRQRQRKKLEQEKKSRKDKQKNSLQQEQDYNSKALDLPAPVRQRKRHNNNNNNNHERFNEPLNRRNNKHLRPNPSGITRRNSNSNVDNSEVDDSIISSNFNSNHVRNRNHNNNNNNKNKKNRRWYSVCDAGLSDPSGGDIRLIEKCSWPQCNKSCPKLLNPLTGEEVDFKDLLKSFGLDMGTMAKALGIDLNTLNSMDHQVLLQMLTQHA